MVADQTPKCASCSAQISAEVPEYYVELESFRLMSERIEKLPRRGSKEYHEAMERLMPQIHRGYFQNPEMYDTGHRWCPVCGSRLMQP
jgi:DNA-directed RNA polymerase subunit RPC12/RpoP